MLSAPDVSGSLEAVPCLRQRALCLDVQWLASSAWVQAYAPCLGRICNRGTIDKVQLS